MRILSMCLIFFVCRSSWRERVASGLRAARELRRLHISAAVAIAARVSDVHEEGPAAGRRRVQLGQTRDPIRCAEVRIFSNSYSTVQYCTFKRIVHVLIGSIYYFHQILLLLQVVRQVRTACCHRCWLSSYSTSGMALHFFSQLQGIILELCINFRVRANVLYIDLDRSANLYECDSIALSNHLFSLEEKSNVCCFSI